MRAAVESTRGERFYCMDVPPESTARAGTVTGESSRVDAPPLPDRLSQAIEELPEHRDSWPSRLREELTVYVTSLRDRGMTPERSLATVKQLARPLFDHSDRLGSQVVGWVLDVYYDRRARDRQG